MQGHANLPMHFSRLKTQNLRRGIRAPDSPNLLMIIYPLEDQRLIKNKQSQDAAWIAIMQKRYTYYLRPWLAYKAFDQYCCFPSL